MAEVRSSIEGIQGFKVAGVHAGLKKDNQLDFALIVSDSPCKAAGVFTTNHVKAAPVLVDMERLKNHAQQIRAVAVNTKCANACTGQRGIDNALQMARWVAEAIDCDENEVLVMSTGVIGTQLPMDKLKHGVEIAADSLSDNWEAVARAIMTTDTRHKTASVSVTKPNGETYTIAGICKGAGMIAPNMATMLSTVVTDVALPLNVLQASLTATAQSTYNCIVIDGDMSTNDTVLLLANGASGVSLETADDLAQFQQALFDVCEKLAKDVVRDGEGVTKFITLTVQGVADAEAAHQIANTIATSPLVKTAFFGGDANWGRIVAAAGRAGIVIQPETTRLWITPGETTVQADDSLLLYEAGVPTGYSEARATEIFKNTEVSILLDCGAGDGAATIWTCDLSHDYVSINGDYRS